MAKVSGDISVWCSQKSSQKEIFAAVRTVPRLVAEGPRILPPGTYEIVGRALLLFVAFIPFFALWELGSLTVEKSLIDLFFRPGQHQTSR